VAKLKVLCARSMHKVVGELAESFQRASGHTVEIEFGTVGALQARISAGASADVLVLSAAMIERLGAAGALVAGSARAVAATSIGIAVREGAVTPDVSTPEAFNHALIAAHAVAFSDPAVGGTAGVYLAKLFTEMGIADDIARKGMPQQNGAEVARRVAEGSAEIGMTLMAEIAPIAGVRIVGPLPAPYGHGAAYCAAVTADCQASEAARAFIAALVAPDTRALWNSAGFQLPAGG
jgi:molybdate transport system substrate-binding protein